MALNPAATQGTVPARQLVDLPPRTLRRLGRPRPMRFRILRHLEAIPEAADCLDPLANVAELGAQSTDMHVHRARLASVGDSRFRVPRPLEELLTALSPPPSLHQGLKQAKLGRRQVELLSLERGVARVRVEPQGPGA